jgi:glycosyltransferase involved in cell wall biosynthesis
MLLGTSNLVRDNRVRKEARSLCEAGASVTVYCYTEQNEVTDSGLLAEPFHTVYVNDISYAQVCPSPAVPSYFELTDERWPRFIRIADHLFFNFLYNNPRSRGYTKEYNKWNEGYQKWLARYTHHRPYFTHMQLIEKPDVVHAHDLDTLYAGAHIARAQGASLVYDSHEVFLQQDWKIDVGNWLTVFKDIEREYIHDAAAVITVMPEITHILKENYRFDSPTVEIYNGSDTVLQEASRTHDPVRFLFSGTLDPERNLFSLVDAMRELSGLATLTFQGFGGIEEELKAYVKREGLDDIVFFVDPVSPKSIVESYREFDIGILIWKPKSKNMQLSAPNKLFDYMGAGLALVAPDELTFISSVINNNANGYCFTFDDSKSIEEIFRRICQDRNRVFERKKASLKAAQTYCWDEQAKKLVELYFDISRRTPNDGHS